MKIALMIIGGILVVFGLADLIGSFTGYDLWGGVIGVQLPDIIWKYSAYGELLVGYFIFKAGMSTSDDSAEEDAESA